MNKFLVFILILMTPFTFADELQVSKQGKVTYSRQATAHWDSKPWSKGTISDNAYKKFQTEALKTRYEQFLSSQTASATVGATVSRKAVLAGAFSVAKAGAKIAAKALPYVGAASYAYEAYEAVKGDIETAGYKYDEASDEFLKYWDNKLCIWDRRYPKEVYQEYECIGVDSSTIRAYNQGGKSQSEAESLMQSKMESMAQKYWPDYSSHLETQSSLDWTKYQIDTCTFDLNGGGCTVSHDGDIRNVISFKLMRTTFPTKLNPEEFLKIATGSIDSRPTPFVEAQSRPEYSEEVKVPAGTVVTIGPVTDKDGQVKQIVITFGTGQDGKTNASVSETARPDIEPNSPTAPSVPEKETPKESGENTTPSDNPNGDPEDNPDDGKDKGEGGTGTGTGSQTGSGSKTDKDKGTNEDGKTRTTIGPKKETEENEQGFLCSMFPNILACAEVGNINENDNPFKIPTVANETTFEPQIFLPDTGQCPAPLKATYLGIDLEFKYDFACQFAERIRFLIIGLAAVAAAYIMFSSTKD